MPDLTRLQQLLQESKALAATGRAALHDPEGAQIRQEAQDALERALRAGRPDIAWEAGRILENLLEKEAEVRRTLAQQSAADQNAETVIREVRKEFGDKG
ncbi:hypothetical protein ACWEQG_01720 [Microbispora sp. NPDC004025]